MPTTTTGLATSFITFSRPGASGGGATVTDADGKIKWAGHNLLTNSESFDASAWTKTVTAAANTHAAPNSTTTADTLTASGANQTALQSYTALAVPYTFGVWLKRKTGTGNIQIAADSGTYTTVTITSDWALYTVTQTPAAGTISTGIRIVTSGDEVYAWGAHLYRSDMQMQLNPAMPAGMQTYYPTTPRNLLGFTEDFSNAAWVKANTTVTANSVVAPNGLQTADKLVETTANDIHTVRQEITNASGRYTFSAHVKAAERNRVIISMTDNTTGDASIGIDLTNGTTFATGIGVGSWTSVSAGTPVAIGDGWYRVSITATRGAGTQTVGRLFIVQSGTTYSYTGDGTSGIYLWGAQLSDSASLDTYVPQYGAAVSSAAYYAPRLDFDPVTLAAKGLLVEEQRSNLVLQSAAFDAAAWTPFALNTTGTPQWINVATAPDGTMTADKIIPNTSSTNVHAIASASITVANATAHTWSVYAKADGYDWLGVVAYTNSISYLTWFNVATGAVGTNAPGNTAHPPVAVGNGWYRLSITRTTANTSALFILYAADGDNQPTFAGDGTKGVLVWGAQLEQGSFATSYIPTGSATATRAADVASVSTQAFPYSASEGTLVVSGSFSSLTAAGIYGLASLNNGASGNSVNLFGSPPNMTASVYAASVQTASYSVGTLTNPIKAAIAYKLNDVNAAVNGVAQTTDTTADMPTGIDRLEIGRFWGNQTANGHIRQITYLPRRISNAELQSRTA